MVPGCDGSLYPYGGAAAESLSMPAGIGANHHACYKRFLKSVVADWRNTSVKMGEEEVTGGIFARGWGAVVRSLEKARCLDSGRHTSF